MCSKLFVIYLGGSETFKDKQDFFYHEVRKYHQKHFHDKLVLKIARENLLESVSGSLFFSFMQFEKRVHAQSILCFAQVILLLNDIIFENELAKIFLKNS